MTEKSLSDILFGLLMWIMGLLFGLLLSGGLTVRLR